MLGMLKSEPDFVDLLISNDILLSKALVIVYPYFLSPQTLFSQLLDKFQTVSDGELSASQTRIVAIISFWADRYWSDFDDKMIFGLDFLANMIIHKPNFQQIGEKMMLLARKPKEPSRYDWGLLKMSTPLNTKKPKLNMNVKKHNWVTDLNSNEIADQLTITEWILISKIDSRDFLQHSLGKTKIENALTNAIGHFNFISSLVKTLILIQETPEYRAEIIIKFIKVAQHLRACNNFHTLLAVYNGIDHSSIRRLAQTQKLVCGHDVYESFQEIKKLLSTKDDYSLYRSTLEMSNMPCIPYIGLIAKDVMILQQKAKHALKNQDQFAPDISSVIAIGEALLKFESFKIRCYAIKPDEELMDLIKSSLVMNEEVIEI